MLDPTPALFYKIIVNVFDENSTFASRSINKIKLVEGDNAIIPTLAVGKDGIILVNKEFWRKNVKTLYDAAFVFIHELFHVITGDTLKLHGMSKEEAYLANLSMDMRINCAVYHILCNVKHKNSSTFYDFSTSLKDIGILKMYKPFGIEGLLRPFSNYPVNSKYRHIYSALYSKSSASDKENNEATFKSEESIREALRILMPKNESQKTTLTVFIGNHSGANADCDGDKDGQSISSENNPDADKNAKNKQENIEIDLNISSEIKDQISDVLSNAIRNAGISSAAIDSLCDVIDSNRSIDRLILSAFSCNHKINEIKSFFKKERRINDVVPIRPSSRDMGLLATGIVPAFWKNIKSKDASANKNIAIYLDVSGSVHEYLPKLLGIIKNLDKSIKQIYCFSNIVSEHSMVELSNGKFTTTGGTDFDCIASHLLENNEINKIIIFTDGYANLSPEFEKQVASQVKDAAIIYFGQHVNKNNFFDKKYNKSYDIEEILK